MVTKNTVVNVVLGVFFSLVYLGTVQAAVSYALPTATPAAAGPVFLTKGNLNGDANLDLVSVNVTAGSVTVLLSDGAGGFSGTSYTVGTAPQEVAIGDLDGVNGNDLVVTNSSAGTVTVLLNDGSGGFAEATGSPINIVALAGAGALPFSVVIAQFNSVTDAFADIAVANDSTNNVQMLLGVGDGTFTTGNTITVGTKPTSIAAGSVNTATDALIDIVVANFTDGTVSVLLGNGDGTFNSASGSPFSAGTKPFSIKIASIDSSTDVIPDIALVNFSETPQTARVFVGVGDGTFSALPFLSLAAAKPRSVEVTDLDADGIVDLAIASDNSGAASAAAAVTVLLGLGDGTFPTVAQYPLGGTPNSVVATNLDNTNQVDLVVANGNTSSVDVLLSVPITNSPTANAGSLSVTEDTVANGTLTGADLDGALLRFALDGANPPGSGVVVITNEATGAYSYTPNTNVNGGDSFGFTVDDGTGVSAPATITVTIAAVNDAPTISGTPGTSVNQDVAYSFTPTANDPDVGDTLTFSITNRPTWATFSTTTGALTGTPTNANVGMTTGIVISVSDGIATPVALPAFNLTVANVNDAPTISGTPGTSVNQDVAYSFTPTASDPDVGDTLAFSITNQPTWATFSTTTGALTGTPTVADVGTTTGVVISVSDGIAAPVALSAFNLTVALDTNGDGISDVQAAAIGLDPQLTDTDGDASSDVVEVGGDTANPVDTDGDGIIDALEFGAADPNILGFVVPAPTATMLSLPGLSGQQATLSGNGAAVTANNNGTTGLPLYAEGDLTVADASFEYPFGVYDFSVVAIGGTATVTLTLPAGIVIPTNAVVRKLSVGNQWQTLGTAVIDRNSNSITLTLADNDGVFDLDNTAGVIRDPVGVAVPVPVASSGGGGGGGCNLSADPRRAGFDPILPLLALVSLLYLRRKRKQNVM